MSDHPLAPLGQQYRFNNNLLDAVSADFSRELWARHPGGEGNSAWWILGHITLARRRLSRALGIAIDAVEGEDEFWMGATPDPEHRDYPEPEILAAEFRQLGEKLMAAMAEMSTADAEQPFGHRFPDGSEDLKGGARFMFMHESYHLGQIGLLRRVYGLPGFR